MAQQNQKQGQDSKKGRPSSAGKRKGKFQNFFSTSRMAERKIRRILRHGGSTAMKLAQSWADKNETTSIFRRIVGTYSLTPLAREQKRDQRAVARKERRLGRVAASANRNSPTCEPPTLLS